MTGLASGFAPLSAFLIAVVFHPAMQGAATSPRWAVAALSLWFVRLPALVFIVYIWAALDINNFDAAVKWTLLVAAFCLGTYLIDLRWLSIAFACGVAISAVLAVAQSFGYDGVPQAVAPAGLFVNKNVLGGCAALAVVAVWNFVVLPDVDGTHRISTAGTVAISLVVLACLVASLLTGYRTGLLALIVAAMTGLSWRRDHVLLAGAMVGVFLVGAVEFGGFASLFQRLALWQGAVSQLRWFGAGTPLEPLHNDLLQTVYELGVGGLVVILFLLRAAVRCSAFVACVVVIATFDFAFHLPAAGWFAAVVLGHCVGSDRAEKRERRVAW